jgi:hypothetical protein
LTGGREAVLRARQGSSVQQSATRTPRPSAQPGRCLLVAGQEPVRLRTRSALSGHVSRSGSEGGSQSTRG